MQFQEAETSSCFLAPKAFGELKNKGVYHSFLPPNFRELKSKNKTKRRKSKDTPKGESSNNCVPHCVDVEPSESGIDVQL